MQWYFSCTYISEYYMYQASKYAIDTWRWNNLISLLLSVLTKSICVFVFVRAGEWWGNCSKWMDGWMLFYKVMIPLPLNIEMSVQSQQLTTNQPLFGYRTQIKLFDWLNEVIQLECFISVLSSYWSLFITSGPGDFWMLYDRN